MANTPLKSTFENLDILRLLKLPTISFPAPGAGNEGAIVYDSTTQVLKVSNGTVWNPVGSLTLSAIGSTPNANGATVTGSALNLEPANASFGGVISTVNQVMGDGDKMFPDKVGIGITTSPAVSLLQVGPTINAFDPNAKVAINSYNTTQYGLDVQVTHDGAFDPLNGDYVATSSQIDYDSSVATTGTFTGFFGNASTETAATVFGVIGVRAFVRTDDSGTTDNAASFFAQRPFSGDTSVITRGYGLYIANAGTQATTSYNLFIEGTSPVLGPSGLFYTSSPGTDPFVVTGANRVGIGTIAPANLLNVVSAGSTSEYSRAAFISSNYSGTGLSQAVRVTSVRSGSSGTVSQVVGLDCFHSLTGGTGSITMLASVMSKTDRSGGPTVTNQVGFYAQSNGATGAAVNAGFYAGGQITGTICTAYYSESFSDANYIFYYYNPTAGRQFAFKGNGWLGIGNVSPDSFLHITGAATGSGTMAHLDPGSYAFTGTKYGLKIDPISGGTVFNMAIDYTGASSQFKVYGNARTKVVNSGGLSSDFGGGAMVTAFEANTSTTGVSPTTHAFGTYTSTSFTGSLGLTGGVYGYNSDMGIAHTAGAVATVAGSNIGIVITATSGTIGNLFGHVIGFSRPSGTGAITNQFGVYINPIELATGQRYSIWANGPTGTTNSWQVSGTSRMSAWVQDTAHPGFATYLEGFYYGAAHDTNVTIVDITSGYIDAELFGSNSLTGYANGVLGSVYWAKTGGTVARAVAVIGNFYSDTATGTVTNLTGFETTYNWNATPTVTTQFGIRLAPVDKGVSRWGIYIDSIPRIAGQSRAIQYGNTGQYNFIVEDDASTWVWSEGTDSGTKASGLGTNTNLAFYGGVGLNSSGPGPNTVDKVMGFWADPWWWDEDVAVGVLSTGFYSTPHNDGTTLTRMVGFTSEPQLNSGTVTNMVGFWSYPPVVGTGAVTNAYGIRIDALTLGTSTNTAIGYDVGGSRQFLVGGDGVVTYRANTSITAFAGGGQGSATLLTAEHNFVVTVATAGDSVRLPTAVLGKSIVVFNRHATNSCDVFPASGGAIDALGTNVAYALAAGASRVFYGQSATQWHSR